MDEREKRHKEINCRIIMENICSSQNYKRRTIKEDVNKNIQNPSQTHYIMNIYICGVGASTTNEKH